VKVLLAAGGTGGHIHPALAIVRELLSRDLRIEAVFVGTRGGLEASLVSQEGLRLETIEVRAIQGRTFFEKVLCLAQIPRSLTQAWGVLSRFSPQVVVGMGGYASGPVVLAAALRGIPTLIHEQNAYPGLTNRWLSRVVDVVALSFFESASFLKGRRVVVTGNPIRRELLEGDREEARKVLGLGEKELTTFAFGGSQGAHRINQAMAEALQGLEGLQGELQFLHATGERDLDWVEGAYRRHGFRAAVRPYFHDMTSAYAASDLCICRAGASTIAELCALGKPALLVPYPFAANDHQRLNSRALAMVGGAEVIRDQDLDGGKLAGLIRTFLHNRSKLEEMAARARSLGRPGAAARLADLIYELAR